MWEQYRKTLVPTQLFILAELPLEELRFEGETPFGYDALTRANLQDEITRIRTLHNQTIVLVTNDPDEAILLADRVVPLTAGPNATLGPSFTVDLEHPRDRKALNHNVRFRQLRRELSAFLLNSRHERQATVTRKLILPDIEPEDLNLPRSLRGRTRPLRSSEVKVASFQVTP